MKSPLRVTAPKGQTFKLEIVPSKIYTEKENSWALSRLAIIACLILQMKADQPGQMPLMVSPRLLDPSPHIFFSTVPNYIQTARAMVQHVADTTAAFNEGESS